MKKVILAVVITLLFSSTIVSKEFHERKYSTGIIAPLFGWNHFDENNNLIKVTGVNALLGYTKKKFFYPVELNEFNPFWSVGTWYGIIPYIGVGTEYLHQNGVYASFQTVYYYPSFNVGYYF
ncbi:hypothetical protein DID80_08155 [Candidatus Marinamargulisbacteria bacterium SCGC AAA071-K20]|nr:hypothetical protein DID80_08155 [Candidatus Marinamargulisbacteria bacterium SCGC AAA071-K20]